MPAEGTGGPLEGLAQAVIELVDVSHAGEGGEEEHEGEEAADVPEGVPDGLWPHHDVDLRVREVQLHVLVVQQVVPTDRLRDRRDHDLRVVLVINREFVVRLPNHDGRQRDVGLAVPGVGRDQEGVRVVALGVYEGLSYGDFHPARAVVAVEVSA